MMNGWHLCRVVVWGQRGSADCLLLSWFYMLSMYSRTELNTVGAAGWKQRWDKPPIMFTLQPKSLFFSFSTKLWPFFFEQFFFFYCGITYSIGWRFKFVAGSHCWLFLHLCLTPFFLAVTSLCLFVSNSSLLHGRRGTVTCWTDPTDPLNGFIHWRIRPLWLSTRKHNPEPDVGLWPWFVVACSMFLSRSSWGEWF